MIVARGWISADMAAQLTGAIVTIVAVLYSAFFHAASNGSIPVQSTNPTILAQQNAMTKAANEQVTEQISLSPTQLGPTTQTMTNYNNPIRATS